MSGSFFQMIFYFIGVKVKYERIKSDGERSKSSVYLGVMSIVNSVIWAAIAVLAAWGLIYFFAMLDSSFIIGIVMVILCAAIAVVAAVYFVFGSVLYFVYQLRLNKRPIGYAAIAVWLVCAAVGVVLTLLIGGAL